MCCCCCLCCICAYTLCRFDGRDEMCDDIGSRGWGGRPRGLRAS